MASVHHSTVDFVRPIFHPQVHVQAFQTIVPSGMLQSFIIFLDSIWLYFTRSDYQKYFTVVQSSGWGKSRLMDLFCQTYQRVLIYACFRTSDSPASGYPPGVKAVKDAFEAIQTRALGTRLGACKNLLRAVVQLACEDSTNAFQNGINVDPQSQNYEDLWKRALVLSVTETFESKFVEWLNSSTAPNFRPMKKIQNSKADNFKVFLVFDEVSHLLRENFDIIVTAQEWDPNQCAGSLLSVSAFRLLCCALYRVQVDFIRLGIVAVFIDTNSSISKFAPTTAAVSERTARDRGLGAPVPLPVYWQINAEPTMFTGLDPFLFGRPMIGGYYNAVKDTEEVGEAQVIRKKESSVIRLCEIKMQDSSPAQASFSGAYKCVPVSKVWVAATMCCLLDLKIRASSALPNALIRSYMATCLDVSQDREQITTHYPCEPVLARGVLNNLLRLKSVELFDALKHFQQLQHLADICIHDQTLVQLICLLMLDDCQSFDAKFLLTEFLSRLLGWSQTQISEHLFRVFQINDLHQSPTLNLCQFQLFEQYPNPEDLERCFKLGMGIVEVNAAAIDLVIPLKLHDGRYSAIVFQIKNWKENFGSDAAKSMLDEIGWVRVFEGLTNQAFDNYRDSLVAAVNIRAASEPATFCKRAGNLKPAGTSAPSSTITSDHQQVVKNSKRSFACVSIGESASVLQVPPRVHELQALFKEVPFVKLLFLIRDDGTNELFVEQNDMETALCGVLRGIPTEHGNFRDEQVQRTFQRMVSNYRTRRFVANAECDGNFKSRQLHIKNLFANSVRDRDPGVGVIHQRKKY